MLLFDNGFVALLSGSALIGLAAGLLVLLTGRVMSASGMIGSLLSGNEAEGLAASSIAFIGGIAAATLTMTGLGFSSQVTAEADWPFLVVGGLLVGFGARFGGVSLVGTLTGIARRSRQSAAPFGAMLVGAVIAVYLQFFLSGGVAA